jgi:hypothetical protein
MNIYSPVLLRQTTALNFISEIISGFFFFLKTWSTHYTCPHMNCDNQKLLCLHHQTRVFEYELFRKKHYFQPVMSNTYYYDLHLPGLRAGRPRGRSSSPGRVKNSHFSTSSRPALGSTQPPIQRLPGVKRPGREADHSPPTSAEVKKMRIYTSTPL